MYVFPGVRVCIHIYVDIHTRTHIHTRATHGLCIPTGFSQDTDVKQTKDQHHENAYVCVWYMSRIYVRIYAVHECFHLHIVCVDICICIYAYIYIYMYIIRTYM